MTYELINSVTTNTIAAFASERDAVRAFEAIAQDKNELAEQLVVVAFNDDGEAVTSHLAAELVENPA